jgi:hypothetical protein
MAGSAPLLRLGDVLEARQALVEEVREEVMQAGEALGARPEQMPCPVAPLADRVNS